ncbi:MAG TPA: flavodoxin family protein [Patescibacteria group bacterium]
MSKRPVENSPKLSAVLFNCTLKASPETSNTEALLKMVAKHFDGLDVTHETVRVVDYHVPPGVTSDEGKVNGKQDEWPKLLDKIKAADIFVLGTPIWFGVRGSIAQRVIERLDGVYMETNDVGQFPMYNKVAGVAVTGNEDGAHDACGTTLYNLGHLGFTVPPNVDTYWVGPAGPGDSFIKAGGEQHPYTVRTAKWTAHNLVHVARILKANPVPPEGNTVEK